MIKFIRINKKDLFNLDNITKIDVVKKINVSVFEYYLRLVDNNSLEFLYKYEKDKAYKYLENIYQCINGWLDENNRIINIGEE